VTAPSDLLPIAADPLERLLGDVVPLLDLSVEQHDHAPWQEQVEESDFLASQFEEAFPESPGVRSTKRVAAFLEELHQSYGFGPVPSFETPHE
jgi:hypothetical protein